MHILVVCGDRASPEFEISKVTGKALIEGARACGHSVVGIEVDGLDADQYAWIKSSHATKPFDLLINGLHGGAGEDGSFAEKIERMGICYTHSGRAAAALGMDKVAFKFAMHRAIVEQGVDFDSLVLPLNYSPVQMEALLPDETFVSKPIGSGSSLGVVHIRSLADLEALANEAQVPGQRMNERYIAGFEVTCGVIGTGANAQALPPTLIVKADPGRLLDYDAKYRATDQIHYFTPASSTALVAKATLNEIARISYFAHTQFGFRSASRCDFIVSPDGRIHMLEINSNPGLTEKSFVPLQAAAAGLDFTRLVTFLIEDARIYWKNRKCV